MRVQIVFDGELDAQVSYEFQALGSDLRKADIAVEERKGTALPGVRDGGATIALSILSLAVSGLATLMSVLSYWRSSRPHFSVAIVRGDVTVTLHNLTTDQFQRAIDRLAAEPDSCDTVVRISRE